MVEKPLCLIWFFIVVIFTGCYQLRSSEKTEFLVRFENGNSGQVVIMSRFSSLKSQEVISEMVEITDVEGKVIFKNLPVPSAYRISILKNGEKKLLVGYMLGEGASRQDHALIIHRDGGTTGTHKNKDRN